MNQPSRSAPETPPAPDLATAAFFLDFDGTLAPIAPRPDLARIGDGTRAILERLEAALGGALAIVSGRSLADLDALLAPLVLPAAGSHGLERRTASGAIEAADGGPPLQAEIARIVAFGEARGLLVERKRAGVAVHYRERPELEAECLAEVDAAVARLAGVRAVHGKMLAEFALAGADKGSAVDAFMAEAPFKGRQPIFIGDDRTDEDGFRAAIAAGGQAIKIGPGPTAAPYRLPDIDAFLAWLGRLAG